MLSHFAQTSPTHNRTSRRRHEDPRPKMDHVWKGGQGGGSDHQEPLLPTTCHTAGRPRLGKALVLCDAQAASPEREGMGRWDWTGGRVVSLLLLGRFRP